MRKILVVIDMQNDFISGALGTKEAQDIIGAVIEKIHAYNSSDVFATRDTHDVNYLATREGKYLPIEHCIENTWGWQIQKDVQNALGNAKVFNKNVFASMDLASHLRACAEEEDLSIELIGVCTDICVVSNAILISTMLPSAHIQVDSHCCAGVTVEKHIAALETMRSCQIEVL